MLLAGEVCSEIVDAAKGIDEQEENFTRII